MFLPVSRISFMPSRNRLSSRFRRNMMRQTLTVSGKEIRRNDNAHLDSHMVSAGHHNNSRLFRKMSDYRHPTAFSEWGHEEHEAIKRVIRSCRFTMGAEVEAFEHEF